MEFTCITYNGDFHHFLLNLTSVLGKNAIFHFFSLLWWPSWDCWCVLRHIVEVTPESWSSIRDNSCFDLNVESKSKFQSPSPQSSFCKGDNEFSSEDNSANEHNKNIVGLNLMRDLYLNSISPSYSDVVAHNTSCTNGEEKCKESTASSQLQ